MKADTRSLDDGSHGNVEFGRSFLIKQLWHSAHLKARVSFDRPAGVFGAACGLARALERAHPTVAR